MDNHTFHIPSVDQLTAAARILAEQNGDGMTVASFAGEMDGDTLRLTRTGTYDGINVESNVTLIDRMGEAFDSLNVS